MTNVVELGELLPMINITGDERINEMARAIQELTSDLQASQLRVDKKLRSKTAKTAEQILKKVSDFI